MNIKFIHFDRAIDFILEPVVSFFCDVQMFWSKRVLDIHAPFSDNWEALSFRIFYEMRERCV